MNLLDLDFRSAAFIDKILKGTPPANLPIERAVKFELIVNLKTAKALGREIRRQADRIVVLFAAAHLSLLDALIVLIMGIEVCRSRGRRVDVVDVLVLARPEVDRCVELLGKTSGGGGGGGVVVVAACGGRGHLVRP